MIFSFRFYLVFFISLFLVRCLEKKDKKVDPEAKISMITEACELDFSQVRLNAFPKISPEEIKKLKVKDIEITSNTLENGYDISSVSFTSNPKGEYAKYCIALHSEKKKCSKDSNNWIKLSSFGSLDPIDDKYLNHASLLYLKLCILDDSRFEVCSKSKKCSAYTI